MFCGTLVGWGSKGLLVFCGCFNYSPYLEARQCVPKWFIYSLCFSKMTNLLLFPSLYFSRCSLFMLCKIVTASCLTFQHRLRSDLLVRPCLPWDFLLSLTPGRTDYLLSPTKIFAFVFIPPVAVRCFLPSTWRVFRDYCCAVVHKLPIKLWRLLTVHNCCVASVSYHTHVSKCPCIYVHGVVLDFEIAKQHFQAPMILRWLPIQFNESCS